MRCIFLGREMSASKDLEARESSMSGNCMFLGIAGS